jgi:hypothetical protein
VADGTPEAGIVFVGDAMITRSSLLETFDERLAALADELELR